MTLTAPPRAVAGSARAPLRTGRHDLLPWWSLFTHTLRGHVRTPTSTFFVLVLPLTFLVVVLALVGNVPTANGVPLAQSLIAPFAVFGVAEAMFCVLTVDLAEARESGVLRRLRAAPVSGRTLLSARIGAALVLSALSVTLLTLAGTGLYGVELFWGRLPALVLTLVTGAVCCAALGLAVAAVARTATAAQALTQGLLIPVAFVSDILIPDARLPGWLDVTASVLPLRHFAAAMSEVYAPGGGHGVAAGHLAVLVAWGLAGAVVVRYRFSWEPRGGGPGGRTGATARGGSVVPAPLSAPTAPATLSGPAPLSGPATLSGPAPLSAPAPGSRPSPVAVFRNQTGHALASLWRDPLSIFFGVVFPALLLALFPVVFGASQIDGLPMAQYLLPGMTAYSIAVLGYVNLPEVVVHARAVGVLKRLRGTPLSPGWYAVGRITAVGLCALVAAGLLTTIAVAFLGVRLDPARLPAMLAVVLLGAVCASVLGFALVALLSEARSMTAVALGTLLPVTFVSEIFPMGDAPVPGWVATVGDALPLRQLARALREVMGLTAAGAGPVWESLAIVAGWTLLGLLVVLGRPGRWWR